MDVIEINSLLNCKKTAIFVFFPKTTELHYLGSNPNIRRKGFLYFRNVMTSWRTVVFLQINSTGSFLWDVCEPNNSRLKLIDFIETYRKFEIHENGKMRIL